MCCGLAATSRQSPSMSLFCFVLSARLAQIRGKFPGKEYLLPSLTRSDTLYHYPAASDFHHRTRNSDISGPGSSRRRHHGVILFAAHR